MTKLCSTKRAAGSVFYPCLRSRRAPDLVLWRYFDRCGRASKALQYRHLHDASRGRAPLDGRRVVPPNLCRQMVQPWRERPPFRARSLTPGAPPGVVHATASPCRCPAKRHVISPPFRRVTAAASQRVSAPNLPWLARGHRSPIAVRKESVCR
jgi:hypothetical protein